MGRDSNLDLGGDLSTVNVTNLVDGVLFHIVGVIPGVGHQIVEIFGLPMERILSQYPSTWGSTSSHYDTNKEYGIPFPRVVESTQWSRKSQIAGLPVDQIKVVDMVPKGLQNYGIRLLANGRYVAFEMFRTRLDALIASTLFKELYKQRDSIDVYKLLSHFNSSGSDWNEWTVKHDAVQSMCENIATHLKQYMPQDSDQALYLIRVKNCVAKMRNLQPSANRRQQPLQILQGTNHAQRSWKWCVSHYQEWDYSSCSPYFTECLATICKGCSDSGFHCVDIFTLSFSVWRFILWTTCNAVP